MDLKTKILAAKRMLEPVDVPEWGETVFLRRMSGGEFEMFASTKDQDLGKDKLLPARVLLMLCLCDADGKNIFADPDELKEIDGHIINRLTPPALELNGLTKKAQEEIAKN